MSGRFCEGAMGAGGFLTSSIAENNVAERRSRHLEPEGP